MDDLDQCETPVVPPQKQMELFKKWPKHLLVEHQYFHMSKVSRIKLRKFNIYQEED